MLIIGFSRLKTWRRCHRLYNYRYRQFLVRRAPRVQLLRGSILHEMLDAHVKNCISKMTLDLGLKAAAEVLRRYEKEYGKLFKEQQDEYGDLIGDCRQLFSNYVETYSDDRMQVIASEQTIRFELIPGKVEFKCTVDRVMMDSSKPKRRRWLLDTKSHKNLPGEDARFYDLQLGVLYFWAWNRENRRRPADGIIWDYIRTKLPSTPEVLQSGKLSQRANIDTTYAHAAETVRDHCNRTGESPKAYAKWLESLKGREEKFLKRVFLPSPPRVMIDTLVDEMKSTALEIHMAPDRDERSIIGGPMGCSSCEFRDLCMAELRGQDANFIRQSEFKVDEEAMDEENAEED